ncbi:MAG: PhnD/SsuA/transferrin family substrate-binding protein, partial [Rhodobacteraceae bacterium]|nr:PhnD/SsuA/transferrin family substrate-binding protein [Paracoccaceae bacterium]
DHWLSPDLVLSQTCGLPYRTRLHGRVVRIATPDYGLPGCPPGYYCSHLVVRADDPRDRVEDFAGAPIAINSRDSQSGWASLAHMAPQLADSPILETGAHALSVSAVASGRADLAAIDAQTWRLLESEGATRGVRVIGSTPPTPGLPLIAAAGSDAGTLRDAVAGAIAALAPADRAVLGLRGLVDLPDAAYLAVPTPPLPAQIASLA